jgi:integral membrane protein (TIGR01906 family)
MKSAMLTAATVLLLWMTPLVILIATPLSRIIHTFSVTENHSIFTSEQRQQGLQYSLAYLRNWSNPVWNPFNREELIKITDAERAHMADVRTVIRGAVLIWGISALAVIKAWQADRQKVIALLKKVSQTSVIVIVAGSILMLLGWNLFFTTFHLILFPQGNWAFPAESTLIQLFPEQFWQALAASYILIVGIICVAVYFLQHSRIKQQLES